MVEVIETAIGEHKITKIEAVLDLGGEIDIAVAYLTQSGLDQIWEKLEQAICQDRRVKMVIDLHCGITEPDTLDNLVALSRDKGNKFECKAFFGVNPMFHAKLYLSRNCESISFVTGSFNLTGRALGDNLEHGLYVKGAATEKVCMDATQTFDEIWKKSICPTDDQVKRYRESYTDSRGKLQNPEAWVVARQFMEAGHWLFKCNPAQREFHFGVLSRDGKTDWGEEVDHPQSKNNLRERVLVGDRVIIYHTTNNVGPEIASKTALGCATVTRKWISPTGHPRVDLEFNFAFYSAVTLEQIQDVENHPELQELAYSMTVFPHSQLNIQPLKSEEFEEIVRIGGGK